MSLGKIEDDMSPEMAEFMQDMVDRAHRTFPTLSGLVDFHEALKLVVAQIEEIREEQNF